MDIVLRATAMFAVLYLLIRFLGKRELSQLTPFEMVVLVVMGDLIQQGVTHNDFSVTGAALAVITFAFWAVVLSWASYLSPRAEKLLDGRPRVIIKEGELLQGSLRRDRLTRSEVESEMRLAGIPSMGQVAWAILEPQGKISFIRKDNAGPADQKDKPNVA
ncbi:MAG TPA: YetF domain-containing protein [Pararhizobium sp.]|nr:YetF domain-containing protein [Pararhizobium sp.]